jgi:hypothetical protein
MGSVFSVVGKVVVLALFLNRVVYEEMEWER